MKLGAFSISLDVADLGASRQFYETLGFEMTGGEADAGWLIMKNGPAIIGLFNQMFEGNIITLNPGLGQDTQPTDEFTDVRDVQARLRKAGIEIAESTDPDATGPAHIVLSDPDGNQIMIDQFFDRPAD
jgi:catechol 2,3-dioxygenase-like lactoylglutathione lyase family enzyme